MLNLYDKVADRMRFSQWMYSFFDLCLLVKFYLIQKSIVADDDLSFNQNMFSKLKRGFPLLIISIFPGSVPTVWEYVCTEDTKRRANKSVKLYICTKRVKHAFSLKVQPHLKKCFDNIKSLKMAKVIKSKALV